MLREQGIEFTLATGRNMEIVMPFVKALDLRVPIITNGGAEIYDGERFIVKHAIALNDLLPIIEIWRNTISAVFIIVMTAYIHVMLMLLINTF